MFGKNIGTPGSSKKPPPAPLTAPFITKRASFKTTPLKKTLVPTTRPATTPLRPTATTRGPPPATKVIINPRVGGVDESGEVWVGGSNVVANQMTEPVSINQY